MAMRTNKGKVLIGILLVLLLTGCGQRETDKEEAAAEITVPESTVSEDSRSVQGTEMQPDDDPAAEEEVRKQTEAYEASFDAIENVAEIAENGYDILEEQIFPVVLESFGTQECTFLAAMERSYHRIAIFLADADGNILYKTNELEANYRIPGQLEQPIEELSAVTFSDLDKDGRTDIVLIARCVNDTGEYAGKPYKIGDVLFQGEHTFYRDWRISDKINRFDMNKSVNSIIAYVRDGQSTEFLYTATTLDELLQNGFSIIEEQHYTRNFEKLGRIQVVPGTFRLSEYDIFMIYLVNEQGDIVWCFQPMGSYDNLYSLRGVVGKDVDGDGMKDLIVLARYTYEGSEGELLIQTECSIYYQRTGGFDVDTGFTESYLCTEEDTMEALIPKIRAYWGWQAEEAAE
jgi:PBP1b-binding outer membrane lipoprotein LpoB